VGQPYTFGFTAFPVTYHLFRCLFLDRFLHNSDLLFLIYVTAVSRMANKKGSSMVMPCRNPLPSSLAISTCQQVFWLRIILRSAAFPYVTLPALQWPCLAVSVPFTAAGPSRNFTVFRGADTIVIRISEEPCQRKNGVVSSFQPIKPEMLHRLNQMRTLPQNGDPEKTLA
jgi:hypothetical protein